MDIRQLQYMTVLAETLHFGRAAQHMHIAPSAFSAQIARLERQIGAQLFDRSANRVTLTPAGEAFLPRAQAILNQVADASEEARILHGVGQKILRIGHFFDGAGELTPLVIEAFRRAMPGVELSFHELSMVDQVDSLAGEAVDIAFIRPPVIDARVQLHELYAQPRVVGLSTGHRLASLDYVSSSDLMDEAFAVPAPEAPPTWGAYWSCDDLRGSPGRVAASVRNVSECLHAIAYQGAIDTVPSSATRFLVFPGVVYRPLVDGSYSTVAVATRTGERRAHVEAFRRIAQQLAITSLSVVPDAVPVHDAPSGTPRTGCP